MFKLHEFLTRYGYSFEETNDYLFATRAKRTASWSISIVIQNLKTNKEIFNGFLFTSYPTKEAAETAAENWRKHCITSLTEEEEYIESTSEF